MVARLSIKGMDSLVSDLNALQSRTPALVDRMLAAGASELVKARKAEAELRGYRDTGRMIESIAADEKPRRYLGASYVSVYARGKDPSNWRPNSTKEFFLHYGRYRQPGSHWVDEAERKGQGPAIKAMEKVLDAELVKDGLL